MHHIEIDMETKTDKTICMNILQNTYQ